jgi:hypothetical protein
MDDNNAGELIRRMQQVVEHFCIRGNVVTAVRNSTGHINETVMVTIDDGGRRRRYTMQRINQNIFKDVDQLMSNAVRVSDHLRRKLAGIPGRDPDRETLIHLLARDGRFYARPRPDECWRAYPYIENAYSIDVARDPREAYEAARGFGEFQSLLADFPEPPLFEIIPHFHDTARRFKALEDAIAADAHNRAAGCRREIEFALARKAMTGRIVKGLADGEFPRRVTHNDTKINNVLIDYATGRAQCVIDLDSVMPGSALYDFGDMVRTFTPTSVEDEQDLSKFNLNLDVFREMTRGFLENAGAALNQAEKDNLVLGGRLITFTIGIRFLTDYLLGDVYFRTHRPGHNLDRARTQFKLVHEIETHEKRMMQLVRDLG